MQFKPKPERSHKRGETKIKQEIQDKVRGLGQDDEAVYFLFFIFKI